MCSTICSSPLTCTLRSDDFNEKLAYFARLARQHLLAQHQDGQTLRLHYAREALPEVRSMVELEHDRYAHLAFEIDEHGGTIGLVITTLPGTEGSAEVVFRAFKGMPSARTAKRCIGGSCGCPSA